MYDIDASLGFHFKFINFVEYSTLYLFTSVIYVKGQLFQHCLDCKVNKTYH